jgi:hypothetical protein
MTQINKIRVSEQIPVNFKGSLEILQKLTLQKLKNVLLKLEPYL